MGQNNEMETKGQETNEFQFDPKADSVVVEAVKVTPIVTENDFQEPQHGTKLDMLKKKFQREKNIPEHKAAEDVLSNVKVKNEVRTRSFESLDEAGQTKVMARISGVDYMKSADIQTFGSATESPMTKQAEIIISKYTASDVGEISEPMTDLVAAMKSNNLIDIVRKINVPDKKEWGIFSSIRDMQAMKKAKVKLEKSLAERENLMKNLTAIQVELEKQKISLMKDVEVYEQMGRNTYSQIADFEYDCIALKLMIEDAEEKLTALTSKGELDLIEMNDAQELKNAIDRMNRRLYAIQTIRISTVQTVPQIAVLIKGNEIINEKIDEVKSLIIPMWSWQYAIAIGAVKQKEALSIQKTIRGITSQLLTGNAKMLHDNMIAAQEELYTAAVAVEDLATVQEYITDMVTKVNESRKNASQKCVEGLRKMEKIEQSNYALMAKSLETN